MTDKMEAAGKLALDHLKDDDYTDGQCKCVLVVCCGKAGGPPDWRVVPSEHGSLSTAWMSINEVVADHEARIGCHPIITLPSQDGLCEFRVRTADIKRVTRMGATSRTPEYTNLWIQRDGKDMFIRTLLTHEQISDMISDANKYAEAEAASK